MLVASDAPLLLTSPRRRLEAHSHQCRGVKASNPKTQALVTATTLGAFSGDLLTPSRSQKGKPTQFETTLVGEARGENGTHLAFTVFQASDGVKLTLFHHRFGSKTEAQNYFDKCLEEVGKIVTNTATKDVSGVTVRQRAEVVLRVDGDSEKPDSAILWTNGPEFHEIVSKSSEDNL